MSDVTVSLNLSRKDQGALYMAHLATKKNLAAVTAERDALKSEISRLTTPDYYWPAGDESISSSVLELARDIHDYDGTLWDEQPVSSMKELPDQNYRSFLDGDGVVQIELVAPPIPLSVNTEE
jgi:hypothetical protein